MARDWNFTVTASNGGGVLAEVPWRTAKIGWVLDSPGYIEVDLLPEDVSDDWAPGTHRLQANVDSTLWQNCYLTHLSRSGSPDDVRYRAAGVGLEYIFDWRLVHSDWAIRQTAPEHLEQLIWDLQVRQGNSGEMGFDDNVASTGSYSDRLVSACYGVNAGDYIRDLAARGSGFDWWIDISVDPARLTIAKPGRGTDTAFTISEENCQGWTVEFDTSDLLTTVVAFGEKSDPWGPRHALARTGLGGTYGRHEVAIDTDHGGEGTPSVVHDHLYDAAYEELQRRAGARLNVRATFIDGLDSAPWTLGDVEVGDTVTLDLPSFFGGELPGRCTEVSMSLEPGSTAPTGTGVPGLEVLEYVFDTLVEDITEGAESS